jgi:streptogramin lyase
MRRLLLSSALLVALLSAAFGAATAAAEDVSGTQLAGATFAGALTTGSDGNVWFSAAHYAGEEKRVIGKVDADQKATEYEVPAGAESIAAGADGNVWFTESSGIGRITPGGDVSSFDLPPGTGAPAALAAGPDGNLWFVIGQPAAVGRITPIGTVTMFPLNVAGRPSAIAVGTTGELWFTEPDAARIGRVTVTGEVSEFPLPDPGARPGSITLGPDGNLWFSDGSAARVGRITPSGVVTFFPVPTVESTDQVVAGPNDEMWFIAGNEIGKVSLAGKVSWPGCFTEGCEYPPVAMVVGPDGRLWVASGKGHCAGYCGGSSEQAYIIGATSIGPYAGPPPITVGIGPVLSPVRRDRTSIVIGCGEAAACHGTLRLRALVHLSGRRLTRALSKRSYSLAAGEIKDVGLHFPSRLWHHLRGNRFFVIVDALQAGHQVGKRGIKFSPEEGGVAKHW